MKSIAFLVLIERFAFPSRFCTSTEETVPSSAKPLESMHTTVKSSEKVECNVKTSNVSRVYLYE